TTLAIVRRKMEGKSISEADDQHLHHMLKRALGVKGAVFALYGIAAGFAVTGAAITLVRARIIYLFAMVMAAYIGVTAIKIARKRFIDAQATEYDARRQKRKAEKGSGQEATGSEHDKSPPAPILVTSGGAGPASTGQKAAG